MAPVYASPISIPADDQAGAVAVPAYTPPPLPTARQVSGVQGFCLQNFYALSFRSMKYDGVMDRMPLIRPLLELDDRPVEFRQIAKLAGIMDVLVSTECRFLCDLEHDKQVCTTLVSGNNDAAADSIRAIRTSFRNALCLTQMLMLPAFRRTISDEYKMLSNIQLRLLVMPPQLKPMHHPRHFWKQHSLDKVMGFIIVDAANVAELMKLQRHSLGQ
ncbi:hypothetical protein SELMODRAFT_422641 [Selaginella moellendorffii]|uniref:Uncharacterized protein n=1 Tax=Selaginella moellendorffii TaxID=88036 RepID=D8SJ27_SELML|nr:hypothetical protein SELMODRAFT_422641 [Selaginella moellendorffii]